MHQRSVGVTWLILVGSCCFLMACSFNFDRSNTDAMALADHQFKRDLGISEAQTDGPADTTHVPSCTDDLFNGDETDQDCGGSCPPCDTLKRCKEAKDCQSGRCSNSYCTTGESLGTLTVSPDTLTLPEEGCPDTSMTFTLADGTTSPDGLRLVMVGQVPLSPPQTFPGTWSATKPWTLTIVFPLCWNSVRGYVQPGEKVTPYRFQAINASAGLVSTVATVTVNPGALRLEASPNPETLASDSNIGLITFAVRGAPVDETKGLQKNGLPLAASCTPAGSDDCRWSNNHYRYRMTCSEVKTHSIQATDVYGRTASIDVEVKSNINWTLKMKDTDPSSYLIPNSPGDEKDVTHTVLMQGASPGSGVYRLEENVGFDLLGTWSSSACNEYTFTRRLHGALKNGPFTIRGINSDGSSKDLVAFQYLRNPNPRLYVRHSEGTAAPIPAPSGNQDWSVHTVAIPSTENRFIYFELQYYGEKVAPFTYPAVVQNCTGDPNCTLAPAGGSFQEQCEYPNSGNYPPGGPQLPPPDGFHCAWGADGANTFIIGRWVPTTEIQGRYVTRYSDITGGFAEVTFVFTH
jgi:hypothetical protein